MARTLLSDADTCRNGHEWNEKNTYVRPNGVDRICRACRRDTQTTARHGRRKRDGDTGFGALLRTFTFNWTEKAACRFAEPEVFFPVPENERSLADARKVCGSCPVRQECLDEALRVPADKDHGVWGGMTTDERRYLRRKQVAS